MRTLPPGFIGPCLPTKADTLPSDGLWIHEIKHDGFRVIARKIGAQVRLYSRPGNDLSDRFTLIVESPARLRSRSCIIDGEAVCCDDDGMPSFDRIRYRRHDASVFLYAFDLIELNGDDLRRDPLEVRKATLASVLAKAGPGLRLFLFALTTHLGVDGEAHAIPRIQADARGCDGSVREELAEGAMRDRRRDDAARAHGHFVEPCLGSVIGAWWSW
jgi:ATP-dependent DNA ligase